MEGLEGLLEWSAIVPDMGVQQVNVWGIGYTAILRVVTVGLETSQALLHTPQYVLPVENGSFMNDGGGKY